jgi:hypothetical protein
MSMSIQRRKIRRRKQEILIEIEAAERALEHAMFRAEAERLEGRIKRLNAELRRLEDQYD